MKKLTSGKVREVYDTEDNRLIIVTTDRISAFDVILPCKIAGKGKVLNSLSLFWFDYTRDIVQNHLVSSDQRDFPHEFQGDEYVGRTMLVKKLRMLPYEVIVRGYMFGSMYEAYKKAPAQNGIVSVLGNDFPAGLQQAQRLDTPIVTPSTKAKSGHDENVTREYMQNDLGKELADKVITAALAIYKKCYAHAYDRGIIIADTKFEFGLDSKGDLVLADEVLTPDSSRFWAKSEYKIGTSPASYDKQFIRDYLKSIGKAGDPTITSIPSEVIQKTQHIYEECQRLICSPSA